MTTDPFSYLSHGELFASTDVRALLSEERRIADMVRVEVALVRANASCGVIPDDAVRNIEDALAEFVPVLSELGTGTNSAGVPVPALVAQLRDAVRGKAADYVHWGATSQDIVDTALVLTLRDVLALFARELDALIEALADMARANRGTVMLARTRLQQATPTAFGLRVAGWRQPLVRSRVRLNELRPRLLCVQLGGAAGTMAAWEGLGPAVQRALAQDLDLDAPSIPWHTQRDSLAEFAGWLSLLTGALGTMGVDIGLLAQGEVAEVSETEESGSGESSTLPHKSNPVSSEVLVALARYNANALASMHQALLHEGERSGAAWSLEWLTLPNMVLAASGALTHGLRLASGLSVDPARMRRNLEATDGLCLAEAVSFALAKHMPREDARRLVRDACREVRETGRGLIAVLSRRSDLPVTWSDFDDPERHLGSARALVDAALEG